MWSRDAATLQIVGGQSKARATPLPEVRFCGVLLLGLSLGRYCDHLVIWIVDCFAGDSDTGAVAKCKAAEWHFEAVVGQFDLIVGASGLSRPLRFAMHGRSRDLPCGGCPLWRFLSDTV